MTGTTHEDGHTLDLIISRSFDRVVSTNPVIDTYVSDHTSVLCNLDCGKPTEFQEKVSFRKLKSIDMDVFREKVSRPELCTKSFTDLEELVGGYNTTLTNLLDQYTPVKTRTIIKRKCVPWFNGILGLQSECAGPLSGNGTCLEASRTCVLLKQQEITPPTS